MLISFRCILLMSVIAVASAVSCADDAIQFNRDIRPIMLDTCFACHGPDSAARKAELRMDKRDAAIEHGAVGRVRPKMMTVTAIMAGLVPILWSQGTGADVMKRIAAPMVGGMLTSTVLTLVVIPAIYSLWKERVVQRAALGATWAGASTPRHLDAPTPALTPAPTAAPNSAP